LLEKVYETGKTYANDFRKKVRLVFDEVLTKWNYTARIDGYPP